MTAYVAASGETVGGGRIVLPSGKAAMLAVLASMPGNSWLQVNASGNKYSDAWPHPDLRAQGPGTNSTPAGLINCWSSMGWDDTACELNLWGVGHANGYSNMVMQWQGATNNWRVGFHDTRIAANGLDTFDGALKSPMSSHTYANNGVTRLSRRFFTFGGAVQPGASGMRVRDAAGNILRNARLYLCDMTHAGEGMVGGDTGSNEQRGTTVGLSLPGAGAWQLRDWDLLGVANAEKIGYPNQGWAQAEVEDGKDVIYVQSGAGTGGTSHDFFKIILHDINDAAQDEIIQLGRFWDNTSPDMGGAYDTARKVALVPRSSVNLFEGWDCNAPGSGNRNFVVPASAASGDVAALQALYALDEPTGCCYDEVRGTFVIRGYGGALFYVTPPADLATIKTSGWVVQQIGSDAMSPRPKTIGEYTSGRFETGVHGKFRRSRTLDCYIQVTEVVDGEVWIYKPDDWTGGL